jgi:ClpP class serine protease
MTSEIGVFASKFFIVFGTLLFFIILGIILSGCGEKSINHLGKFIKLIPYKSLYKNELKIFDNIKSKMQHSKKIPKNKTDNSTKKDKKLEKKTISIEGWSSAMIKEWFPKKKIYIVYNFDNFKKDNKWKLYAQGDKTDEITDLSQFVDVIINTCDPTIHQIILKISSGGGYAYSFTYGYTQLFRLRNKGFQLIACVDDICASGGYMLAAACNKILAAPYAQLGSIGVIGRLVSDANRRHFYFWTFPPVDIDNL